MTTFIHQTFGQRSAFTCHIPTAIQAFCIPDNQQFTVQTLIQLICVCVSVFLMNIKTCIITYCTCLYMPSHSYYTLYLVLTVSCRCSCSCCCCVLCCGMADIVIYEPASVHRVCLRGFSFVLAWLVWVTNDINFILSTLKKDIMYGK